METCELLAPELSAYLDGECEPAELPRIRAHLTECHRCRETLERWRATGERMRAEDATPREFPAMRAAIAAALTQRQALDARAAFRDRRLGARGGFLLLASAAAVAVTLGGAIYVATIPTATPVAIAELEGVNRAEILTQRRTAEALRLEIGSLRLRARASMKDPKKLDELDRQTAVLLASMNTVDSQVAKVQDDLDRAGLFAALLSSEGVGRGR